MSAEFAVGAEALSGVQQHLSRSPSAWRCTCAPHACPHAQVQNPANHTLGVQVAEVFNPGQMTISLSSSAGSTSSAWDVLAMQLPPGFHSRGSAMQHYAQGGHTAFFSCFRAPPKLAPDSMDDVIPLSALTSLCSDDTAYEEVHLVKHHARAAFGGLIASAKAGVGEELAFGPAGAIKHIRDDSAYEEAPHKAAAVYEDQDVLLSSAASSRSPSPARLPSLLHPCPLLDGQSGSAIAAVLAAHNAVPVASQDQATIDAYIRFADLNQSLSLKQACLSRSSYLQSQI